MCNFIIKPWLVRILGSCEKLRGVREMSGKEVEKEKKGEHKLEPILVSYSRTAHQPSMCVSAADSES